MEPPPLIPSPSQSPVPSRRGWFKRLRRRSSFWTWKLRLFSSSWRWNRLPLLRFSFLNELIFRILYVLEAIVLISTFCFFYLFCGCHRQAEAQGPQPYFRMAHGAALGSFSVPTHCLNSEFTLHQRKANPLLHLLPPVSLRHPARKPVPIASATRASLSVTKEFVLRSFRDRRAVKIISGLQNFDKENVASVVIAAEKGGATHVDIACDPDLVKLAMNLTSLPVCVSSVEPLSFLSAIEAGALMVEIGNYDSFYEMGKQFSSEQILKLTQETRKILPSITLSVTVPHTLTIPDQVMLAELLEQEGADIIQTEGGKFSNPSEPGVMGLFEKATPTIAAAYSISRAVKIPVLCSSGLSAVTAPMAFAAGAAGVGVGSAVNKLNDVVAMIAEVKSIADCLCLSEAQVYEKSIFAQS